MGLLGKYLHQKENITMNKPTKICSVCKKELLLQNFHKNKIGKYGVMAVCKSCRIMISKKHYIKNRQKILNTAKIYREKNNEKIIEYSRVYHKNNKDTLLKHSKIYNASHKKKRQLYDRIYYIKNKRKILDRHNKYVFHKNSSDISFNLNRRMASGMRSAINQNKRGRNWEGLVGYTLDELKNHLESLFVNGMTWDIFLEGKIHIDHIIPKVFWQYELPEDDEFKQCWCLANLQPLWAEDNLKKGITL